MSAAIPGSYVSNKSRARGGVEVKIDSRTDILHNGIFNIELNVVFDPTADRYPTGRVVITTDLSDSLKGTFTARTIEYINTYGKHNPTIFMVGRCSVVLNETGTPPRACRYWLMIANNKQPNQGQSPDVAGFLITDSSGTRLAYGTGPASRGDIEVFAGAD
jgi:hypothetical protein